MRGERAALEVRMIGGWLLNLSRELTSKMVVELGQQKMHFSSCSLEMS